MAKNDFDETFDNIEQFFIDLKKMDKDEVERIVNKALGLYEKKKEIEGK